MVDLRPYTIKRKAAIQLFHYGLIGITINLAGYLIYLWVTFLGGTPKVTMTILYGVSVAVSFWMNRELTFSHEGHLQKAFVKYLITHIVGYSFNLSMLILMVDIFGYAHQWVQAIAILIGAVFFFFAFKFFVFTDER